MKNINKISIAAFLCLTYTGCSSAPLKVLSEPSQAEVFIYDNKTKEQKSLGLTPIHKTKKQLNDFMKGRYQAGSLVNILVKKDGYEDQNILIPADAGGSLGTQLKLKLSASDTNKSVEMKTAQQIVDRVFLAQQYARTKQFERALIEIDKVLEEFPEFDRAMTMKAAILYGQGSFKDSLAWYEKALDVNPDLKGPVEMSARIRKTLKMPLRRPVKRLPAQSSNLKTNKAKKRL